MQSRPLITPSLKGIDQRWEAPPVSAARVRDMRWDGRGFWTSAGGYRVCLKSAENANPFVGIGRINSMHYFSQHNGARSWIIYEAANGNLYEFNPSTATRLGSPGDIAADRAGLAQSDRASPTTPWQRSQSVTWGDNFYIVNGINRPLVFDGYCWDYAGFNGPAGAPAVTLMESPHATTQSGIKLTSVGLGPVSDVDATNYTVGYRWRCSFINARKQESPLSAPSDFAVFTNEGGLEVTEGAHFALVTLPIGGPEVVMRRLYRTQNIYDSTGNAVPGYGEIFFFHSDIPDNVTTQIMDGLLDSNLPGLPVDPDTFGAWPQGSEFVASFKGCMFTTGATQTDVFFSFPGQPERFPINNRLPIGDDYLGPIKGMYGTRNALVVFKEFGIYLVVGDPVNGFTANLFTKKTGCVAPNSIQELPGLGVVFLGASGIHLLRGTLQNEGVPTEVIPLHVPIAEHLKRFNRSALIGAFGCVYHRDKEYWLAVPTIGNDYNDFVLVYHYEIQEWSYRENYPIGCMLETSDHRGHLLFGSNDANTEGIYAYSPGFDDKAGTAIQPMYQSGWFNVGAIWRAMRPKYVMGQIGLHGNNLINLTVTSNRKQAAWPTQPGQVQQYKEDKQPVYGTAVFDAGTLWTVLRPGTVRFDIADPKQAMVHELSVQFEPDAGKRWMSLVALDPEVSVDDPGETKPLGPTRGGR